MDIFLILPVFAGAFFACGFYFYKYFRVNREFERAVYKFRKNGLAKGLLVFGSARIPESDPHMQEVEEVSRLCAERIKEKGKSLSFISGGGPSVMHHWLKPALELGMQTSGMCITLPFEEDITFAAQKKYSYVFRSFDARKKTMFKYAKAFVVFKGGFGTMDELMEVITMANTGKMKRKPVIIYPASHYKHILDFSEFIKAGTISQKEVDDAFKLCNTKEEMVEELYKVIDNC